MGKRVMAQSVDRGGGGANSLAEDPLSFEILVAALRLIFHVPTRHAARIVFTWACASQCVHFHSGTPVLVPVELAAVVCALDDAIWGTAWAIHRGRT